MKKYRITSSHGDIVTDQYGHIIADESDYNTHPVNGLGHIDRFDVIGVEEDELDILEVGYWHEKGYTFPNIDFLHDTYGIEAKGVARAMPNTYPHDVKRAWYKIIGEIVMANKSREGHISNVILTKAMLDEYNGKRLVLTTEKAVKSFMQMLEAVREYRDEYPNIGMPIGGCYKLDDDTWQGVWAKGDCCHTELFSSRIEALCFAYGVEAVTKDGSIM